LKEQIMNTQATVTVKAARKAVYDKVESQIHTFEAQVATLKAKAEAAKADAQLAAIANLATAKRALDAKVSELKVAGEARFEGVKGSSQRPQASSPPCVWRSCVRSHTSSRGRRRSRLSAVRCSRSWWSGRGGSR
jgi:hypothetical protein